MTITTQSPAQWLVTSETTEETVYVVRRHNGQLSCNCNDAYYRGRVCKHQRLVNDMVFAEAARAERITAMVARHNPLLAKRSA